MRTNKPYAEMNAQHKHQQNRDYNPLTNLGFLVFLPGGILL